MSAITPETIAVGHKRESSASSRAYDMSEWYDSRFYKLGLMPRGVELISLEEDRKRSARGLPVMLFLSKNPIPVKADGVCYAVTIWT